MKLLTKIILLSLLTVTCQGALRTNLVNITPGGADILPLALSKVNTNLTDLDVRAEALEGKFPSPSVTTYDGSDDYSVGPLRTPNLDLAMSFSNQIRILFIGDSIGLQSMSKVRKAFNSFSTWPHYQMHAMAGYPYLWGRRGSFGGTPVTVTNIPALDWNGLELYYLPSGQSDYWASGPSLNLFATNADTATLVFYGGATNAILTLAVSTDGSSWTDVITVDESAYGGWRQVTNRTITPGNYQLRLTASGSGNAYYKSPGLTSSTARSSILPYEASGGKTLQDFLAMGTNCIATMLTNLNPHAIVYTQTKNVDTRSGWVAFKWLVDNYATNADVILLSGQPSTASAAESNTNQGSWYQLQTDRVSARAYKWAYVDMTSALADAGRNEKRGLYLSDGSTVHFNPAGVEVYGAMAIQRIGLIEKFLASTNFNFGGIDTSLLLEKTNGISRDLTNYYPRTFGATNYGDLYSRPSNDRVGKFGVVDSVTSGWWIGRLPTDALTANAVNLSGDHSGNTYLASSNTITIGITPHSGTSPSLKVDNSKGLIMGNVYIDTTAPPAYQTRFNSDVKVQADLLLRTNTAPTSVTVGSTSPDVWFAIKGTNGVQYFVPGWVNH